MLRERVASAGADGFDQSLGHQPLRDGGGVRPEKPGDRPELRSGCFSFPTDEGERTRLLIREVHTDTCLKQDLFLRQELLFEEG